MSIGQLIGKGNTAEVYQFGERQVLKLFFESIPLSDIEKEFELSRLVYQLAIPSPNVGEFTQLDSRQGIIYEKINGSSFTQILSSKPFKIREHARYFAELQANFHSKNSDRLPSQKAYISRNISGTTLLTQEEKNYILDYLKQLPDDNKVCHGDYHTDNIILVNNEAKILDWMTGTSGNPIGDVARTLVVMKYAYLPPSMPKLTKALIQSVRNLFVKFYLSSYIKSTNVSMQSIEKWLLPVMAARLVEGIPSPEKSLLVNKIREQLKGIKLNKNKS